MDKRTFVAATALGLLLSTLPAIARGYHVSVKGDKPGAVHVKPAAGLKFDTFFRGSHDNAS